MTEAAAKIPCWLPSREATARVARHHGYPTENALLRIIRKAKVRPVRARGRTAEGGSEGWSLSPLSFEGYAIALDSDVELCLDDMIAAGLLPAPGESEGPVERAWQPADRAVAYLITGYLVEWGDWTPEMIHEMERGEIKLGDLCRDGLPAEGQKSLQAPRELIPRTQFRSEMVAMKALPVNPLHLPKVVVRVDGTVGVSPRHRQQDYMGHPWCLIEVDWARLKPLREEPSRGPLSSAEWAVAVTRKLQGDDKLKGVTRKSELARLLAAKSEEAAKAGEIRRQLKATYLENVLIDWGCWPLSSLE